jgi:transcriptional regulator with XRE-family HTH domain
MTLLSDRIKEALADINLTQAEFARRINVERATVNDWYKGRTQDISGPNLLRAAEALKVNPLWLAEGPPHKKKPSALGEESSVYTTKQQRLLELFYHCSQKQQDKLLELMETIAGPGKHTEATAPAKTMRKKKKPDHT